MQMQIEKFSEEDIPTKVSLINDFRIHSHIHFDLPGTIADTRNWYNAISKSKDRIDFVFKDETNNTIGMSGLTNINLSHSNCEFYILIHPTFQSKGFGKVITVWTTNFAFLRFNLHKVYLYTDSDNVRAINLYKKLGYIQEGLQKEQRYKSGEFKNKVALGLLRNEWIIKDWYQNKIEFVLNV